MNRREQLEEAQSNLVIWKTALRAIAQNQEYSIGSTRVSRANLREVREMVEYYENQVARLERGGGRGVRVRRIIPMDG
jgi:hypothetical protein